MLDSLRMLHSFGLSEGEIYSLKTARTVYEHTGKEIKVKSAGNDEGAGVRVINGKKIGFSFANSKEKLGDAIKTASSISKFSEKSEFSFAGPQKYKNVSSWDRKVAEAGEKELKEIVDEVANGVNRSGSEVARIFLVSGKSEAAIANSSLLFGKEQGTSCMVYAEARNGKGSGFADYSGYKMIKEPFELGKSAGMMAKKMRSPKKLQGGKYTVIFSHETLASLVGLMLNSFSGELKRRKISNLHDKEGKLMFDRRLNIWDDPFAEGTGKSAFDGEGVASQKLALVENGIVRNFYYDRETAAFAGVKKDGNCARDAYSSYPDIGASNTVIGKGEGMEEPSKYVYIESMHGLHTANPTSGDFGAEASVAFLRENGKETAVRGFMVSENVFNLFSRIDCIGTKQAINGEFISPQISFKGVALVS